MGESASSEANGDTGFSVRQLFERQLARGEILFQEGDLGDVVYVVQAGQIELTREGPDGPRLLSRKGPGDLIGEMAVLLGGPRTAQARAARNSSVLELDAATFEAMCIEQPEIAIRVIGRLAARTKELERRLTALGGDDLLRPVVRALLRRSRRETDEASSGIPLSLRELAADAGLSLMDTHRALSQLVDRKLVKIADDRLHLEDREALVAAASPSSDEVAASPSSDEVAG